MAPPPPKNPLSASVPPTPANIKTPAAAQKAFDRYKKCERIYARCYYNGTPIRRLTVAA